MGNPLAGYLTTVDLGGTATAFTDEATTCLDAGTYKNYQISNAAKRALDWGTAVAVKKNGAAQAANTYNVDYARGIVTFPSGLIVTDVILVSSGKYIPLIRAGSCRAANADLGYSKANTAVFGDTGPRQDPIRAEHSVTLEHFHMADEDLDGAGPETLTIRQMIEGANSVFLTVNFGGGSRLSGWFELRKGTWKASLADAVSGSIQGEGAIKTCVGRPTDAPAGLDQALPKFS